MVIMHRQTNLFEIVLALRSTGSFTGLLDGGQQQGDENGDDRNHHQQFDQGKRSTWSTDWHANLLQDNDETNERRPDGPRKQR